MEWGRGECHSCMSQCHSIYKCISLLSEVWLLRSERGSALRAACACVCCDDERAKYRGSEYCMYVPD